MLSFNRSEEEARRGLDNCNSIKEQLEEKRRYDLACPPVVTYGTYRGLREVRRQKKKRRMELHSPVSETEEVTHSDSHEETHISCISNTMSCGSQENPIAVNPSLSHTSRIGSDLTNTETRDGNPANRLSHFAEEDSDQSVLCTRQSFNRTHKFDPDPLNLSSNSGQKQPQQNRTLETLSGNPQMNCYLEKRTSEEKLDSGKDEEVLQLKSVKMVDNILENAFAALQRIEVPNPGSDVLSTGELTEDLEPLVFVGGEGGGNAEQQFSMMLSDQTPSVVLEEALAAGHSHAEGCRSTPSSGYESIAGSDTDIRCCMGVASDITTTNVPLSSEHEEHDANQLLLEHFMEERERNRKAAYKSSAADEPLALNLHIIPKTNSRFEQPTVNVSVPKTQRDGGKDKSQDTAKDNTMSINCSHSMNSDSCYVCTVDTVNRESQTWPEPFNHSFASDKVDSDKIDRPKISEIVGVFPSTQSHKSEEREAPQLRSAEQERIFKHESTAQSDEHVRSGGHSLPPWTSVKAVRSNITGDQSPGTLKDDLQSDLSLDTGTEGTTLSVSPAGRKCQFDFPGRSSSSSASIPHHSRLLDLNLIRVDGGFSIISEEEEMDAVFVNDTGPMHSPSMRRAKTYPFSLSPIYEEESVREETSGNEMLQVPPATEEEQRSVEQPAFSVLSLLQSVSEKLQSSIQSSSDEGQAECLGFVPRPLWDRYSEDCEEDDEVTAFETKAVNEPNTRDELCSNIDQTADVAQDRLQECDGMPGSVGKNANMPFYQYLTSRVIPSANKKQAKHCSAVCQSTAVMVRTSDSCLI